MPMEYDHLYPEALGGPTEHENLWLACTRWNDFKGNRISGRDPETGATLPLFHPRTQRWREHFTWSMAGTHILGLTPLGRTTVATLRLNNDFIVVTWVAHHWEFAAPGNGQVGVWDDGFSSEWTRTVTLVGGEYEFFAYGDDRVQVFLNDEPLMSAAYLKASRLRRTLPTGIYTFRLEHEEDEGGAQLQFAWMRLTTSRVYLPVVRR